MSVKHEATAVGTTATPITTVYPRAPISDIAMSIVVTNEGTEDLCLGGPGVTTTDYGYKLAAGAEATFDLRADDLLHGVRATETATARVLYTGV